MKKKIGDGRPAKEIGRKKHVWAPLAMGAGASGPGVGASHMLSSKICNTQGILEITVGMGVLLSVGTNSK